MPSAMSTAEPIVPLSTVPISPAAAPSNHARRASLKVLSRNIDKVVLGNLLFRTWYYSPYPDSIILGEDRVSSSTSGHHTGPENATTRHSHGDNTAANEAHKGGSTEKVATSTTSSVSLSARLPTTPCECLHVCPYCFRYTPKTLAYIQHLRWHNVIYNPHDDMPSSEHPDSITIDVTSTASSDGSEDASTWPVPDTAIKVYEHGGYTVWDIDGEREKLYCQNLSLFGKLFLEQKSVFFDTGGFHYFVLTYTPPPTKPSPKQSPASLSKKSNSPTNSRTSTRKRTSSGVSASVDSISTPSAIPPDITLITHVLGFFSKETLSWDANNLACILVFPPYQHRNLGQLLMAVSYKLSGWEWEGSIIGGPEKPLSAMGRKSYLRFWSERVARYWMGQTADADGRVVFDEDYDEEAHHEDAGGADTSKGAKRRKKKKTAPAREEMTVKQIGDRTGMLAEDVAAALTEMGVLEVVSPKKQQQKRKSDGADDNDREEQEQHVHSMIVHRSRVLEWAVRKGVDLTSPVKEEGFLGEWALSDVDDGEGSGDVNSGVEVDESE